MLYLQTTEQSKYLAAIAALAPGTLVQLINRYKLNRSVVLGLPIQFTVGGQSSPVQQSSLKLAEKLATLGTGFRDVLAANARIKAFIEQEVATAVEGLGGFDNINPAGEWGFILADASKDPEGWTYALPGLTFRYTVDGAGKTPAQNYDVAVRVQEDGSGCAVFTRITKDPAATGTPDLI